MEATGAAGRLQAQPQTKAHKQKHMGTEPRKEPHIHLLMPRGAALSWLTFCDTSYKHSDNIINDKSLELQ